MDALVDTAWLAGRLSAPGLRIVDLRWYLDPARKGREAYRAGHLPGAVFLDVDGDLSAPGGGRGPSVGRHPWPSEAQVGRVMGAAGIGPGTTVVAYDDTSWSADAVIETLARTNLGDLGAGAVPDPRPSDLHLAAPQLDRHSAGTPRRCLSDHEG